VAGTQTPCKRTQVRQHTYHTHTEFLYHSRFAPGDTKFASASDDQTIKIWDFASGVEEQSMTGMNQHSHCLLIFTPHKNRSWLGRKMYRLASIERTDSVWFAGQSSKDVGPQVGSMSFHPVSKLYTDWRIHS